MGDSVVRNCVHIVFATSSRRPFLKSEDLRHRLWAYMAQTCRKKNCEVIEVGGWIDHAHLAIYLSQNVALSALVREVKKSATRFVHEQEGGVRRFSWQRGYAAFSVSRTHVPALKSYIANQLDHHRGTDFTDEWKNVLGKNGVKDEYLRFE